MNGSAPLRGNCGAGSPRPDSEEKVSASPIAGADVPPGFFRAAILTTLITMSLLASIGCASSYEASVAEIATTAGWEMLPSQKVWNRDSRAGIGVTPLNDPNNRASELFVWITATKDPGQRIRVDLDSMKLTYGGREFLGEGWRCPSSGPVVPRTTERQSHFDSREMACALVHFPAPTQSVKDRFSVRINDASVNGKRLDVPEIHFHNGRIVERRGFL
jgi:hypothetical protein